MSMGLARKPLQPYGKCTMSLGTQYGKPSYSFMFPRIGMIQKIYRCTTTIRNQCSVYLSFCFIVILLRYVSMSSCSSSSAFWFNCSIRSCDAPVEALISVVFIVRIVFIVIDDVMVL